jgi:hypothetical protein
MDKIINFNDLWAKKNMPNVHEGFKIIMDMEEEDASATMDFLMFTILHELRVELGLIELDEEQEKIYKERGLGKLYQQINEVYKEAAGSCYFCDHDIDPNEPMPENPPLCMICNMKIRNFLKHLGYWK